MTALIHKLAKYLPQGTKNQLYDAATRVSFLMNYGTITTPDGQIFDLPHIMHPNDVSNLKTGQYEKDEIHILRHCFSDEAGTILEIGSNIGVVARYAIGEKLAVGGSYIGVEPNPNAHKALQANMARTEKLYPGRNIQIVRAAIGDVNDGAEAEFRIRANLGSGLTALTKPEKHEKIAKVKVQPLCEILAQSNSQSISLVCDAEGGEIGITKDNEALEKIRQIAIELHPTGFTGSDVTPEDMVDRLQQQGFVLGCHINNNFYFSRAP